MSENFMSNFPHMRQVLKSVKFPIETGMNMAKNQLDTFNLGFDLIENTNKLMFDAVKSYLPLTTMQTREACNITADMSRSALELSFLFFKDNLLEPLEKYHKERKAEAEFLNLFTEPIPRQDWTVEYDDSNILLDLPSLRLIDISIKKNHSIKNYAVVFAPRAGHHSNIAERVAIYMRDQGLTRMAIVEQKSAEDIPLIVDGKPHDEGFSGQVKQYKKVFEHLKKLTGHPAHLIAICQPGPLLMATLILNPDLGKTFGSAGSPMDTEAERGFLTDFARAMGPDFMSSLVSVFGRTISCKAPGEGREIYDGSLQVLGFYFLGMTHHYKNFRRLLADLKSGNETSAQRQRLFYQWYNYVHHFPAEFIKDTYEKIFVKNELAKGKLKIDGKCIGIKDYPESVPIWALGGTRDDITPPLQAVGHMNIIKNMPSSDKLTLISDGGHMGLFRSKKILERYYSRISEFLMDHSDV